VLFRSHFLTGKEKYVGKWLKGKIIGKMHNKYNCTEERFANLATWALYTVNEANFVVLEGYAMGAKGLVFHIGENTGNLKHELWRHQKPFVVAAPTTIKKFASGKGNANKDVMYETFTKETGIDLLGLFEMKKPDSPVNDIVDSYYMVKYAHHLCNTTAGLVH